VAYSQREGGQKSANSLTTPAQLWPCGPVPNPAASNTYPWDVWPPSRLHHFENKASGAVHDIHNLLKKTLGLQKIGNSAFQLLS